MSTEDLFADDVIADDVAIDPQGDGDATPEFRQKTIEEGSRQPMDAQILEEDDAPAV